MDPPNGSPFPPIFCLGIWAGLDSTANPGGQTAVPSPFFLANVACQCLVAWLVGSDVMTGVTWLQNVEEWWYLKLVFKDLQPSPCGFSINIQINLNWSEWVWCLDSVLFLLGSPELPLEMPGCLGIKQSNFLTTKRSMLQIPRPSRTTKQQPKMTYTIFFCLSHAIPHISMLKSSNIRTRLKTKKSDLKLRANNDSVRCKCSTRWSLEVRPFSLTKFRKACVVLFFCSDQKVTGVNQPWRFTHRWRETPFLLGGFLEEWGAVQRIQSATAVVISCLMLCYELSASCVSLWGRLPFFLGEKCGLFSHPSRTSAKESAAKNRREWL